MILRHHFPAKIAARCQDWAYPDKAGLSSIPSIFYASKQLSAEAQCVLYEEVPFAVIINRVKMQLCNRDIHAGLGYLDSSVSLSDRPDLCNMDFVATTRRIKNFEITIESSGHLPGAPAPDVYFGSLATCISGFIRLVERKAHGSEAAYKKVSIRFDHLHSRVSAGFLNIDMASRSLQRMMVAFCHMRGVLSPSVTVANIYIPNCVGADDNSFSHISYALFSRDLRHRMSLDVVIPVYKLSLDLRGTVDYMGHHFFCYPCKRQMEAITIQHPVMPYYRTLLTSTIGPSLPNPNASHI
jgi:hypothetical protein